MKSLRIVALAFVAACLISIAQAGDPTGTWKWTSQGRNGPQELTATLALKAGELSGSVASPRGSTDISDASFKDDAIAFSTVLTFNANKLVIKYEGKLDGDTIKGTIERPSRGGGAPTKTDWTATRAKDDKK